MIISDLLEETFLALSSNKVRSGLTTLGIIIGISSVITMVSIGQGSQTSIQTSIQSIGANLIQVQPGSQRSFGGIATQRGSAKSLTTEDAQAIADEISVAQAVAPEVSSRYQVAAKGTNTNTSIVGTTSSYTEVRNVQVAEGSFITDQQQSSMAKVAVLGPTVSTDLFGEGVIPVGQTIRINGSQFTVIGVTVVKGGNSFSSQDDMIFIPLSTAQRYFSGDEYVTNISVQATSEKTVDQLETEITNLLLSRHTISDSASADFSLLNQADIIATASSVTETFTMLLAAVAGISLVVGGIGIMNMMLTSVTERTKEIGLRKAIGAKRQEIEQQFLVESVVLTLAGGIIGIALGLGISFVVSAIGIVNTSVSWSSVLLAFGVSATIGIVFGYYPARRAAGLNPIVALRYE
ncbi:TPA: multidrug ABC transporter substrate-binding protein [Candidatus Uhrbacteria bacterium]|uniref:ABC transporter, permease protein n=2 Tax=Candidatus Uhriibacteriota TaxID=1752732 RepID=A0A0G1Q704_9BACT|nr:MAG: ABC transporter, permease protein [Candidatus Uhrbacteria bacterium GW2011_GWF2_46_218]KKU40836.1 MAG: ABC transporter, permease protein [Candidatus Uhrbacteria bacterium GW2011_GWE2_46_68]HBK33929.1 multidrug ABC transporter substrate-binding protein [Candidatus Uhrbacteria bacterium]HCB19646.1 multidrug ABC transporter substrate-binding protein [Candidatus Uhrbacteria bacterium]